MNSYENCKYISLFLVRTATNVRDICISEVNYYAINQLLLLTFVPVTTVFLYFLSSLRQNKQNKQNSISGKITTNTHAILSRIMELSSSLAINIVSG